MLGILFSAALLWSTPATPAHANHTLRWEHAWPTRPARELGWEARAGWASIRWKAWRAWKHARSWSSWN